MLQRARDGALKKSAVFGNFGFHHLPVVKRPLMPVRMELDVDAGRCEAAQLLFIHNLEQVLPFNLIKRDAECGRQLLQELEAIARRQRRAEILCRFFGLCRLALQVESSDPARQMDQLRGGSPEQVRNGYGINRHPVLDIISRYIDRNWNF